MTTDGTGGYLVDTNVLVYGHDTLDAGNAAARSKAWTECMLAAPAV